MTTYYVDFTNGLDANNGLGPDASAVTNKPWKTIAKLLGAAGMASGDTAYLAPGSFREVVTVAMTSAVAETSIIGDPGNAQGFKTSGGVLVTPGDVVWTAYTTNDTSAPSGTVLLNLAGRDFLTFQYLTMVAGSAAAPGTVSATTTNSVNITFRDCVMLNEAVAQTINYTGLADIASNWLIERCVIVTLNNAAITVTLPTSASADYDTNFIIRNCLFLQLASTAITVTASGAGAFKGGGVVVKNCTMVGTGFVQTGSANISTSIPVLVYNNITYQGTGAVLNANAAGQILSDFNRRIGSSTVTNVTPGANDISGNNSAPLLEIGQSFLFGRRARQFMSPTLGSPLLGFGSNGAPTVDFQNRTRPSGVASLSAATGYLERHDSAIQETSVTQASGSAIKIVGPGDHDITVPVDASATTLTIYARYDTTHDAATKPQVILLANGTIGVATETKTMTAAADTWEQLTFSPFTPSAKGTVTLRCVSRPAAGGGIAYFDTLGGLVASSGGLDYFRNNEPFSAAVGGSSGGGGGIFHSGVFGD